MMRPVGGRKSRPVIGTLADHRRWTRSLYSEQVAAIILIESTFSFGAGAPVLVAPVERLGLSTVPVTSTLWPTWGAILLTASSSSLYRGAVVIAELGVPLVPVAEIPAVAFASTN
jgi:hypothetical protein